MGILTAISLGFLFIEIPSTVPFLFQFFFEEFAGKIFGIVSSSLFGFCFDNFSRISQRNSSGNIFHYAPNNSFLYFQEFPSTICFFLTNSLDVPLEVASVNSKKKNPASFLLGFPLDFYSESPQTVSSRI